MFGRYIRVIRGERRPDINSKPIDDARDTLAIFELLAIIVAVILFVLGAVFAL